MPLKNSQVTLFAVVRQESAIWVKKAEQDSYPVLEENDAPAGGPWTWEITSTASGFTGSPTVNVTPDGGDGKTAQISWANFAVADWRDGRVGTFEVQLTDGSSNVRGPYTIDLALRSIPWIDFTVIQGQSGSGADAVRQAPPFGGAWAFSATPQPGYGITLAGDGSISVTHAGDWTNKSTTFELTVSDGVSGHPSSTFDGSRAATGNASQPTATLRKLVGDGYTLIAGQSAGGNGISADAPTGAGHFAFSPSNLPTGVSLTLGNMGQVAAFGGSTSGTFDLDIQDGARPSSSFTGRKLDFRSLNHKVFYWFDNQTAVAATSVNAAAATGSYAWSKTEPTVSLTPSGAGNINATVTRASGSAGTDTPFDVTIQDGARPASVVGAQLKRRHVTPDPLSIPYVAGAGSSSAVSVQSDATTTWKWGLGTFAGFDVVPSFPLQTANTATVSWGAGGLDVNGDAGTLTFSLQPNDVSAPACTVRINCNVLDTTAPQPVISIGGAVPTPINIANNPFPVTVDFGVAIPQTAANHLAVPAGCAAAIVPQSGDHQVWTFSVSAPASATGTVTLDYAAAQYTDAASNPNLAAAQVSRTYDTAAPTPVISPVGTVPNPIKTTDTPFQVTVDFGLAILQAAANHLAVPAGCSASIVAQSGAHQVWTFDVSVPASATGTLTLDYAAAQYSDAAGNPNAAAAQFVRTYNTTAAPQPLITIDGTVPDPINIANNPFPITVGFGVAIPQATANHLAVPAGCSASIVAQAGDHADWAFHVTVPASSTGIVTLDFPANIYQDAFANWNVVAVQVSRDYDTAAPKPVLSCPDGSTLTTSPITIEATFGQSVGIGIAQKVKTDVGSLSGHASTDGGATWSMDLTLASAGVAHLDFAASEFSDAAGNPNVAADTLTLTYAPLASVDIYVKGTLGTTLPKARERMRYQATLEAVTGVPFDSATDTLVWTLDPGLASVLELVSAAPPAYTDAFVQTISTGSVAYIPSGWSASSPKSVAVSVVHKRSGGAIGTGSSTLSLPVDATKDTVDVALLVDRSGSMMGTRWAAAMSGAALFAQLVKDANLAKIDKHRAGLYWFWGRDAYVGANYPNPSPAEAGYPDGFYDTFTSGATSYNLLTGDTLVDPTKISAAPGTGSPPTPPAGTLAATCPPDHCTALASGLMGCRDELLAPLAGTDHEKVILALTDGMENRPPMLADVFYGATPAWGDLSAVRIYASTLLTGASYTEKLRDVVAQTGGFRALDVKEIDDAAQFGILVQKWFVSSFKSLFGFTAPSEIPDPELAQGQVGTHEVPVTLGCDKLVFYSLFGAPDASMWDFGVIPPGQDTAIYFGSAASYPGVKAFAGNMYKAMIFDLPLRIPGQEHRWAGTWKMVVSREAAGSASYAAGALAHQDMETRLDVVAPPTPLPGDTAKLRATVRDQDGAPVTDAAVTATVRDPGPWPGGELAVEVGHNLALVERLRRSTSKANADTPAVADRVLRDMYEREALHRGVLRSVALAHKGGGLYEAEVFLKNPGAYDFDVTITGQRRSPKAERDAKLGAAVSGLSEFYTRQEVRAARAWLAASAGSKQRFVAELRSQLAVAFAPTVKDSETGGYFEDAERLRLLVQPRGKGGVLLGPGYADAVLFFAPGGIELPWPSVDLGDGNYEAEIRVTAAGSLRYDTRNTALAAAGLELVHPVLGPVSPRRAPA